MPTAVTPEPFSLAGMGEMLRETNADLAAKTGVDEVEPPEVEPSPDPEDHKPEETTNDETPEQKADDKGGGDPNADTGNPTAADLEAEQKRQQEEADKAKKTKDDVAAAAKSKEDEEKAAKAKESAAAKKPEDEARDKRDTDLNVNLSPHTHPKTRQIITSFKENARKARDERDAVIRELKQKLADAAQKATTTALPKEVDEELKTLRERVRELDISKDPAIEAKYDKPMAANTKAVVDLLRSFDADKINTGTKENPKIEVDPRWEKDFLKGGLTLKNLSGYIEKMDKAGFVDEAEQLREAVRENLRITRAKQQEIDSWKADYDTRVKTRNAQTQQQTEQEQKAIQAATDATLQSELAELSKTMPFLNAPPAPQANDSEPVRKAKQAALDEYNAAANQVAEAMKAFGNAKTPEEARAANAKFSATAILGLVLRSHALPRLLKDGAAKDARIKELETQLTKFKGATSISRQHASLAAQPNGQQAEIPTNAPTNDAFAAFAKTAGINVNS